MGGHGTDLIQVDVSPPQITWAGAEFIFLMPAPEDKAGALAGGVKILSPPYV